MKWSGKRIGRYSLRRSKRKCIKRWSVYLLFKGGKKNEEFNPNKYDKLKISE